MSLFSELVNVYDENSSKVGQFDESNLALVPIAHTEMNVQVEISLSKDGEFETARQLAKDELVTIIPATPASVNRTSKAAAYPLEDKICYVAGDFADSQPTGKKKEKAVEKHQLYLDELKSWVNADKTPPEIAVVLMYVEKNSLFADLLQSITDKSAQTKIKQGEWYVRFVVGGEQLYRSRELFEAWTQHFLSTAKEDENANFGTDYVTGEHMLLTNSVEGGVSKSDNSAKLISANDNSAYTYRGLFLGDEFYQLGYVTAQKAIHTLQWLVKRQATYVDNRAFVFWGTNGQEDAGADSLNLLFSSLNSLGLQDEFDLPKQTGADNARTIFSQFRESLQGLANKIDEDETVTVAAFDAATTGRMAVVYYQHIDGSSLKANVLNWAKYAVTERFSGNQIVKKTPTFKQVIQLAYRVGVNSSRFNTMAKRATMNLMSSMVSGQPIQADIYQAAFRHVIRPNSYKKTDGGFDSQRWWNDVYTFSALANYRAIKENSMIENELKQDRSYLFGELLALADRMEARSLRIQRAKNDAVSGRMTTALRYYGNFTQSPATGWLYIKRTLMTSYLRRLSEGTRNWYLTQMQAVEEKINWQDKDIDKPVSYAFVAGFADEIKEQQVAAVAKTAEKEKNND
ncbi:type I-C CRISPR-associated protein Cas8c/Csd1 [Lacticaseibacillus zhaodongensis]|uniref:type I-C CRISPR-associated protein Cas8c/Csd1 n=1 Tax=Lacticaseibacillus zhaodongensis TaxID=2668065 RepID=UPI0012D2A3E4|nr:type I-C CRISPR-associated protein Cas8c/Csd1 [Lacticaseibacillus zhaodongensis]